MVYDMGLSEGVWFRGWRRRAMRGGGGRKPCLTLLSSSTSALRLPSITFLVAFECPPNAAFDTIPYLGPPAHVRVTQFEPP